MNVVIGSLHRSNPPAHARYFLQCAALRHALREQGHRLRVIAVEGDSNDRDRTWRSLSHNAMVNTLDIHIVRCNHGGPHYGSTESPDRLSALSKVANACFDAVTVDDDVFIYVESDLIWTADSMLALIHTIMSHSYADVIAPLVFAGEHFYDTFVFRGMDGTRFAPFPPYHDSLLAPPDLTRVSSAGSCLVMGSAVARDPLHRMTSNALLEFCANVVANNYRIYVDPSVRIYHP